MTFSYSKTYLKFDYNDFTWITLCDRDSNERLQIQGTRVDLGVSGYGEFTKPKILDGLHGIWKLGFRGKSI